MVDWARPMKKLRKRLDKRDRGPRPLPLAPGETAGSKSHLLSLLTGRPPFKVPPGSDVVVAGTGFVALGVEGCMAIPGGGIALRGWVSDPHGEIAGLWLEIDGMLRPANIAVRLYRKDVLEQRRLLEAFPGLRTGCYVFEACDVQPDHETVVNLHAITQTPGGFVVLSSGTTVVPGHHCSVDRLTNEFHAGLAEASAISAAARPFLTGLASTQRQIAWRGRHLEAASEVPADLAVVVVVNDNVDMIPHLLATLEACRSAERMEVILSLQNSGIEREVDQYVNSLRGSSFFASIKTLVPEFAIGFGQAASGGVAFARSAAVALASDEILPPNGDWAGTALELLAKDPHGVLIPAIATFDHRPFTFDSVFAPAWTEFAHDHSGLADVAGLTPVRKVTAWSSGFLVADRDTLEAAGGLDDSLSDMDICLIELVLRIQFDGTARLQHLPGAFTHLRLPPYKAGDRVQRLWSLYALAENIRHRLGGTAQCEVLDAESRALRQDQGEARADHGKSRSDHFAGR